MRKELSKIAGVRTTFTAEIAGFGKKNNFRGLPSETVLLKDVKNEAGEIVTDHLWFVIGKRMNCVFNNVGKKIEFDARVTTYEKGYKGRIEGVPNDIRKDFKLSNPTNLRIL